MLCFDAPETRSCCKTCKRQEGKSCPSIEYKARLCSHLTLPPVHSQQVSTAFHAIRGRIPIMVISIPNIAEEHVASTELGTYQDLPSISYATRLAPVCRLRPQYSVTTPSYSSPFERWVSTINDHIAPCPLGIIQTKFVYGRQHLQDTAFSSSLHEPWIQGKQFPRLVPRRFRRTGQGDKWPHTLMKERGHNSFMK